MKLICCPGCEDVVRLIAEVRHCQCGNSWGLYSDALNAVYGGMAIPLGFANDTFLKAIINQPDEGDGKRFTAFVIPKECPTFKRVDIKALESECKYCKGVLTNTKALSDDRIKDPDYCSNYCKRKAEYYPYTTPIKGEE